MSAYNSGGVFSPTYADGNIYYKGRFSEFDRLMTYTYNASVTDYNNAVQVFPTNLIAGMMGFSQRELLAIPEEERRNPNIKDLFNS